MNHRPNGTIVRKFVDLFFPSALKYAIMLLLNLNKNYAH